MKMLRFVALFAAGLVVGALAMSRWNAHVFWGAAIGKEADWAFVAAQHAEWLAGLRLKQEADVIKQMESAMDGSVAALASYENANPADEKTRQMRDRFLVPVKVYHESYAPVGDTASAVKDFLLKIASRDPKSTCGSAVCQLDDLRLAHARELKP